MFQFWPRSEEHGVLHFGSNLKKNGLIQPKKKQANLNLWFYDIWLRCEPICKKNILITVKPALATLGICQFRPNLATPLTSKLWNRGRKRIMIFKESWIFTTPTVAVSTPASRARCTARRSRKARPTTGSSPCSSTRPPISPPRNHAYCLLSPAPRSPGYLAGNDMAWLWWAVWIHVFADILVRSWGLHEIPKFQGLRELPDYTHSL